MRDINQVILTGRLTADPDIYETEDGNRIAKFSIAVNDSYLNSGEGGAYFFRVTAFSKLANFVEDYLTKGIKINLVGKLTSGKYYSEKTQTDVFTTEITALDLGFAESKKSSETENKKEDKKQKSKARKVEKK